MSIMIEAPPILQDLERRFGAGRFTVQGTKDEVLTLWTDRETVREVLRALKHEVDRPYKMLYDLTAIDERARTVRQGQPPSDFTIVYHLLSFDRNADLRLKV